MRVLQALGAAAKCVFLVLAVLYAVDWGVFETRLGRGSAMGSVTVDQYLSTPLKGNKAEYDYLGPAEKKCSRTIFPQYAASAWNAPCWWLQRHPTEWK